MLSVSTQIAVSDDLNLFRKMLKSVSFADEIIVFNLERRDGETKKIFQEFAVKVIEVKTPKVVEAIRSRQVKEAGGDWVLVMDFDEVIPSKLAQEIKSVTTSSANLPAYAIRRRNFSLGYPLRHGGWGDDYVPRLFCRADFLSWPTEIHSLPQVNGEIGRLNSAMEHHKDSSLSQMIEKTNRYSEIEAEQFFKGGLPRVTPLTLVRKSVMEFIRRYFIRLGFLDGAIGLFQSVYQGYSVFITYAKLYELQHRSNHVRSTQQ